jgi:rod shape-determining protein MreC
VTAEVYSRSYTTWYSTIKVNKGSSDGVREDQPVINGRGLVGKVMEVSDGNAVVMLLSHADFGVSAEAQDADQPGVATPIAGSRNELLFDLVPQAKKVREGDRIVTAGTISEDLPSPFPPGLLIGTVRKVEGEGELERQIHVKPAVDLDDLDFVQVLTKPAAADTLASTAP